MTPAEVSKFLTVVSALDNRTVAPETVMVWHPIVQRIDADVAVEAMQLHFTESTDYLLPAHIVKNAARVIARRERADRINAPRAIEGNHITLDRDDFERLTLQAIEAHRAEKEQANE